MSFRSIGWSSTSRRRPARTARRSYRYSGRCRDLSPGQQAAFEAEERVPRAQAGLAPVVLIEVQPEQRLLARGLAQEVAGLVAQDLVLGAALGLRLQHLLMRRLGLQALFGQAGVAFVSIVVTISTFGALIAIMLSAPRIFFAMADDRLFFRPMARVHPRYGTPHVAIALAAALGVLFVLTRTFEQLADTFVLTLPITVVTLGLFVFVLNAIMLKLTAALVPGFAIDGWLWAIVGALLLALVSAVTNAIGPSRDDQRS